MHPLVQPPSSAMSIQNISIKLNSCSFRCNLRNSVTLSRQHKTLRAFFTQKAYRSSTTKWKKTKTKQNTPWSINYSYHDPTRVRVSIYVYIYFWYSPRVCSGWITGRTALTQQELSDEPGGDHAINTARYANETPPKPRPSLHSTSCFRTKKTCVYLFFLKKRVAKAANNPYFILSRLCMYTVRLRTFLNEPSHTVRPPAAD